MRPVIDGIPRRRQPILKRRFKDRAINGLRLLAHRSHLSKGEGSFFLYDGRFSVTAWANRNMDLALHTIYSNSGLNRIWLD